jgi:hypothetical protein
MWDFKMGGQKGRRVAGAMVDLSLGEVLGLLEARPTEVRIYEHSAIEVRIVKDRALQIGSLEVGSVQAGVRKVSPRQVSSLKVCCRKVGRPKERPPDAGRAQIYGASIDWAQLALTQA